MSESYWIAAGVIITTIIMVLFRAWKGFKTWKDWKNGRKESKNTAANDQKTSNPKAPTQNDREFEFELVAVAFFES